MSVFIVAILGCQQQTNTYGLPDGVAMQQRLDRLTSESLRDTYRDLQPIKTLDVETECDEKLPLAEHLAVKHPTEWLPWVVQWRCLKQLNRQIEAARNEATTAETKTEPESETEIKAEIQTATQTEIQTKTEAEDEQAASDETELAAESAEKNNDTASIATEDLSERTEAIRVWLVEQMNLLETTGDGRYPESSFQPASLYDAFIYINLLGQTVYDHYLTAEADGQLLIFHVLAWDSDASREIHWHFDLRKIQNRLVADWAGNDYCRLYPARCTLQYIELPGFIAARQIGTALIRHEDGNHAYAEELLTLAATESGYAALKLADLQMFEPGYDYEADKAIELINQALEHGVVDAEIVAAALMDYGYVVSANPEKAEEYMRSASRQLPDGEAQFRRARWLAKADFDDVDKIAEYQSAVDSGSAAAMRSLGDDYFYGEKGLTVDKQKGLQLLLKAANLGHRGAQSDLGRIFQYEDSVMDLDLAEYWARRAAAQKHTGSLTRLGYLFSKHPERLREGETAHEYSLQGALLGDALAMNNYAHAISKGQASGSAEQAFEWFLRAAEHGESLSSLSVAWRYQNADGTDRDYSKARYWYQKSAQAGERKALLYLANMDFEGQGAPVNYRDAFIAYNDLSIDDPDNARTMLGKMYEFGYGVEKNHEKARYWYGEAVTSGDTYAARRLGWLYESGKGGPVNMHLAIDIYQQAADAGDSYAYTNLGWLYDSATGVEANYDKAKEYYQLSLDNSKAADEEPDERAVENLESLLQYGETYFATQIQQAEKLQAELKPGGEIDKVQALEIADIYAEFTQHEPSVEKAIHYRQLVADQGDADVRAQLADQYFFGRGVSQDMQRACDIWLNEDYQQHALTVYMSRACFTAEGPDGLNAPEYDRRIRQAAQLGQPEAQLEFAVRVLLEGLGETDSSIDPQAQLETLRQFADAPEPNIHAAFWIGALAEQGKIDVTLTQAAGYYLTAAVAGLQGAQNNLGRNMLLGTVSIGSKEEGYQWVRAAYLQGNSAAADTLGEMYEHGWYGAPDWQQALRHYQIAAEAEQAVSMYNCWRLLQQGGHGLEADAEQASQWLRKAADAGYPAALQAILNMH